MSLSEEPEAEDGALGREIERVKLGRPESPVPSCMSMKSDFSMEHPTHFRAGDFNPDPRVKLGRPESPVPSCMSMKSDFSMEHPTHFRAGDFNPDPRSAGHENMSCDFCIETKFRAVKHCVTCIASYCETHVRQHYTVPALQRHRLVDICGDQEPSLCQQHHRALELFCKTDQTHICSLCSVQEHRGHDTIFMSEQDVRRAVTGEPEDFCTGGFRETVQTGWLQTLKDKHKEALKTQFEVVSEGIAKPGEQTLLDDIFTHVWITEGSCVEVNHGHEVMQVETVSKSTKSEIHSIKCSDIFKPLPGQTIPTRTVMMKGVAGIGKTFSVQKFILDWATGKDNQDFDFIFFLPFRELNLIKSEMSLQELVLCFCPEIKSSDNVLDGHKVLFIFDGLDESKHPLNFKTNQRWSDVEKQASVDVLLTNLIKRNFPVNSYIWITSRPAAAGLIPPELISRVTEVQGFEDQQKEEYIRKKCKNRALADRIISHIKTLRSLYILCYVPVFCWIVVTVLEHTLEENSRANPTTLTDFYTYFLLVLLTAKEQKEKKETVLKTNQDVILKLGKLAFESLEKNIIVFYEEDLKKYGIDLNSSSFYSGVWKEIFKQDSVLFQEKVYCFLHLTVQEYFAALYVLGSHQNSNINPLEKGNPPASTLFHLNKVALGRAIQSKTGHLDLFVRFLLGMLMKNNQELLRGFLSHTQDHSSDIQKTAGFIKELIRKTSSPERYMNLFHCLSELKDKSLMDEFSVTLDKLKVKVKHSGQRLSPSQCSALAYFSLLSEKEIDVFNMSEYATSEECVRRLLPVAKITKTLRMRECGLTERCCEDLASALQSQYSSLRKLNLSKNNLGDSGVKLLSAALRDPNCKLTTLWMSKCGLTERCCEDLASVLQSQHSILRDLFLSDNNLGDSGLKLLSAALRDPNCKLTGLWMWSCKLTESCCEDLASALQSQHSSLRELELGYNNLGDSGVKLLSAALREPNCKLTTLKMCNCELTERCCEDLASVLQSQHSSLTELDLGLNNLGDSGVKLLSAALRDPNCKLTTLKMERCGLTERCCEDLASALQSQQSSLTVLDLSENKLGDSGVKLLSAALRDPNCKLTKLWMERCGLTERCCEDLASALQSQQSSLTVLDLSENKLGDSGVKLLSAALRDPNCKLTKLWMWSCELTERCCEDLASVLQSQHSSLTELDLDLNNLRDSGVKLLSAALRDPNCKLTTLKMRRCELTERCCEDLASVLQSQHSSLRELDLTKNNLGDSGVKLLSAALRDPNCKLTTLW
ncbi:NACHT, LRR and PYD domains-containing protein 12-like [Lepisosteus oculatus]|uniref:NACHT, LRR and PYD domains-containing protein 12-like n=1 Tax=Lepisosteus oculatus TaxID=7918 RepID=UPI0035F50A2E